jgi:hypothetical protein
MALMRATGSLQQWEERERGLVVHGCGIQRDTYSRQSEATPLFFSAAQQYISRCTTRMERSTLLSHHSHLVCISCPLRIGSALFTHEMALVTGSYSGAHEAAAAVAMESNQQ